jgi:hypothetical protein
MTAEERFAADKIYIVLGAHYNLEGRWWGQASRTESGITIKVEAYGETTAECIQNLWDEWAVKLARVPNFIPRLEYVEYREVVPASDDIPF